MKPSRAATLVLAVAALAGCPQTNQSIGDVPTATVALEGAPGSLDPRFAVDAYSSRILQGVMRGLTRIDRSGAPVPDLAADWSYPSPTTLRIRLKPGQRFHDGTTITPAIVAATLNAVRDPELGSPMAGALAAVTAVEPTPDGVEIRLTEPSAPLLVGLSLAILHPSQATGPTIEVPIGSGPFRVAAPPEGDTVVLERVRPVAAAARTGGPPSAAPVQRVVFRTIADPTARTMALETGEADLAQNNVPAVDLERLRAHEPLAVSTAPGWNVSYIGFNMELERLADPRVRRAIALAINREAILRVILHGTARATDSLIPPRSWAYAPATGGTATAVGYDPAAARALLDAAGYPDPDGDGPEPRLHIQYKTSTNPERLRIAQAMAADLAKVGIEVELRSLEFGTFFSDVKAGNFEMYSLTWVGVVEPDLLYYALHSDSIPPAGANRGRVRDPVLDRLLVEARQATSRARRAEFYAQAQQRLRATLPVIPLWVNDMVLVRQRRLVGFEPLPGGGYGPLAEAWLVGSDAPQGTAADGGVADGEAAYDAAKEAP